MHTVNTFLKANGPVLAVDIGSGTQDVLLALPDQEAENWPRFVLPTPARRVAARIRELSAQGRSVWLYGHNMGGGFFPAVKEHLAAGLAMAASPAAALALYDKLERVRELGVQVCEQCPPDHVPIYLTDFDPGYWQALLACAGLPQPSLITAAAQDHGVHPTMGNREGRFHMWRTLLQSSGGDPAQWLYQAPPALCTRLLSLSASIGNGPVADTGTAAVLGALLLPEVQARSQREGVLVVNVGNSHVLAFMVYCGLVLGVYEHHTGMHDSASLCHDLQEFRMAWLPDEQVRAKGGHGCIFGDIPPEAEGFRPTFILGPRRELLRGQGQFIAPYGDMMLAGCHGLLYGLARGFASKQETSPISNEGM